MANLIDGIDALKITAKTQSKFYARAINLLQNILVELDGNDEVSKDTQAEIELFLDDNYQESLDEITF